MIIKLGTVMVFIVVAVVLCASIFMIGYANGWSAQADRLYQKCFVEKSSLTFDETIAQCKERMK